MTSKPPLRRRLENRRLGGVCAGVARRWGWNLRVVRIVWAVVALIPVLPGLPLYLALWILLPADRKPA